MGVTKVSIIDLMADSVVNFDDWFASDGKLKDYVFSFLTGIAHWIYFLSFEVVIVLLEIVSTKLT